MTRSPRVCVVGGGIVGLAVADRVGELLPDARITVLEKEQRVAAHQTGRNSGVLHSGLYYRPGSSRAENCRLGKRLMEEFCRRHDVAYEICGKVVVATEESQIPALAELERRGRANGIELERIGPERLRELEPHVAGVAALHVPESGIVDYIGVAERLAALVGDRGGRVLLGVRVLALERRANTVVVETEHGGEEYDAAVCCAGLHSDRLARASGLDWRERIVPFRGEYYELVPRAYGLVRNLVYPTPDPRFPFLGVHFTRLVAGGVECGPNAVLALSREGYRWSDVSVRDVVDALGYPGFLRLAAKHWRTGLGEVVRSLSKAAFVTALRRLVPELRAEDLEPAEAGVRAQVLDRSGALVDDFVLRADGPIVHVLNAPSPAATSALAIARRVVALLPQHLVGEVA
ncbi:MAG: L-2-hydroxyglutarate oxidase [Planctomycetota bacterium]